MKRSLKIMKMVLVSSMILPAMFLIACGSGGGGGDGPTPTYNISGQVTSNGTGLSGVTITLSGNRSDTTTTNSNGNYSFSGLSNGSYTVTPSLTGYTFDPTSRNVTISDADVGGVDFNASIERITVSGNVSPPEGVSPDSLTIVSLGETSSVSATGDFSTNVYEEGVTVVAAMPEDKEFGLMNVVVTFMTEAAPVEGTTRQLKVVSAYQVSTSASVALSSETTAVSMVFITPYFSTNDPEEAADLINIIDNNPKVASLANIIESVFNESDPLENSTLQDALGEAIASVLDTVQASAQSASKSLSIPLLYSPKVVRLPRRSAEFSSRLTKAVATPYSIDTAYISLNISESSEGYNIDVDSIEANAVDWIGEIGQLDSQQFISLSNLQDQATDRFNVYDREFTIGRDRASAKGFLRWIDFIETAIDTAFSYFSSEGVNISSNTDGVYIVRSFNGGGWGADSDERDFLSQVPNGDTNDQNAYGLNLVSAALDGASLMVPLGLVDETCLFETIISTIDSIAEAEGVTTITTVEDIIKFVSNVVNDTLVGLSSCIAEEASKDFLKFVAKVILKSAEEANKWISQYKWFEIAGKTGKILERASKLYFFATPIESVFIVVGDPFVGDITAPTTPTNVTATAVSSNQIDLSWIASTDDVGVAGYNIYRDGVYLKSVTTTSASDTGLSPSTEYCYTVSAYDAAGNESGQSNEACATTSSGANTSPTATITSPSDGSTYAEGGSITFSGFGDDVEDGTLLGSSLVWTSSIDDQIGTGLSFTIKTLSVNGHTITLTATDYDGSIGTNSITITVSSSAVAESPWPMFQHDARHTGLSAYTGTATGTPTSTPKWTVSLSNGDPTSPVIGSDGSIYIGTASGKLYKVNPAGSVNLFYDTQTNGTVQTPALASDNTIYITDSYSLYALSSDGQLKWEYPISDGSSPTIGSDGTVYIGSDYYLYALNPNGELVWQSPQLSNGRWVTSVTIDNQGNIYATGRTGSSASVYKLNPDSGEIIASSSPRLLSNTPSSLDNQGNLYVSAKGGYHGGWGLSILDSSNLDERYFVNDIGKLVSTPAIGSNGIIYVGSQDYQLHALNSEGISQWPYAMVNTQDEVNASPIIDAAGIIYIGSNSKMFYAINPNGTVKWQAQLTDKIHYGAVIGSDGTVYVASYDGNLYAFGE